MEGINLLQNQGVAELHTVQKWNVDGKVILAKIVGHEIGQRSWPPKRHINVEEIHQRVAEIQSGNNMLTAKLFWQIEFLISLIWHKFHNFSPRSWLEGPGECRAHNLTILKKNEAMLRFFFFSKPPEELVRGNPPAANISAAVLARSALLDQLGAMGVNSPVPHIQKPMMPRVISYVVCMLSLYSDVYVVLRLPYCVRPQ